MSGKDFPFLSFKERLHPSCFTVFADAIVLVEAMFLRFDEIIKMCRLYIFEAIWPDAFIMYMQKINSERVLSQKQS